MKKVISVLIASLTLLSFVSCEEKEKGLFESTNSDEIMFDNANSENSNSESSLETIDPFDGLEVQFDGASPYLTIGFNNSKCRQEVQDYVTFTCEQETVANGDTVTVKAEYNINSLQPLGLTIEKDEKTYEVSGCAEYVNDISTIDTSQLDKEIQEYMDAHHNDGKYIDGKLTSNSYTSYILGADIDYCEFNKFVDSKIENTYLCVKKSNKLNQEDDYNFYYKIYHNKYNVSTAMLNDNNKAYVVDIYACIYVKNIISYPDGTIKYDPELGHNASKSKEDAFYEGISSKKEDFNVTKIS